MKSQSSQPARRKLRAASFSMAVNIFLIGLKLAVAMLTGSLAILAEFAHSFFDMLASVLAYAGIKKAGEPADRSHHYGHEKYENFSSFAQTMLIVATSSLIIFEAMHKIFAPSRPEFLEVGLAVMVITIIVDYFVSRYLRRTSREYGSSALEADAYHFTTDLWGALSVIAGLVFVMLGFPVFDAIAAIVVALLMLLISYRLGKNAFRVLTDTSPSEPVLQKIEGIVSSNRNVKHFHKLKARQAGSRLHVELHVQVSPDMSIRKSHRVGHNVKKRLMREMPEIKDVTVHVEPHLKKRKR